MSSSPEFNKSLEANYIVQSIIDVIDDKSFWETHYENLEKEEKNLPKPVGDAEEKKYQKADNLDKLPITEYLKLELEIYNLAEDNFQNVLEKLEEIEQSIPKIFNFKERLKLVVCAVCHMNIDNNPNTITDFESMVKKFNEFRDIDNGESEELSEVKVVAHKNAGKEEELDDLRKIMTNAKQEIEQHQQSIETVQEYVRGEINNKPEGNTLTGGATNNAINVDNITINSLFGDLDPIGGFKKEYKQLIETETKEKEVIKTKMYKHLLEICFSNWKKTNKIKQYNLLNEAFLSFIDKQSIDEKIKGKIKNIVETKMEKKNWTFAQTYAEYLAPFFNFSPISKKFDIGNYSKKFFPNDKAQFEEIYKNTPIADLISYEDEDSQKTFNTYIYEMFSFLYNRLLIEEKIIEHEIEEKIKEQGAEKRKRTEISRNFGNSNEPLLRMFLMFAFDCIHFLSQEKNSDKQGFWKHLEQNVGNGISLEDENFNGEDSLFTFLRNELDRREEGENQEANEEPNKNISTLINKAKYIYLLQNYHYF